MQKKIEIEEFEKMYQLGKELLEQKYEGNEVDCNLLEVFEIKQDFVSIGIGYFKIMGMAYLINNKSDMILIGDGFKIGYISVEYSICDETGKVFNEEELENEMIEDPFDLI